MVNNRFISLDSFGEKLTSYKFYNQLLIRLQDYYRSKDYSNLPPIFTFSSKFYIDSTVLPLLAGLGFYLSRFHGKAINLELTNTPETINIIHYLDKSDFFYIVGNNTNPTYPLGKQIFEFDPAYIGGYSGYIQRLQRVDHKLRCYAPVDSYINEILKSKYHAGIKRDFLLEYIKGRAENEFINIFEDRILLSQLKREFTSIISELVVNGIFHSHSPVFIMAQSKGNISANINTTTISVVDVGIGFYNSLQAKTNSDYKFFKKNEIIDELKRKDKNLFTQDLSSIFEVLCYSLSQKRDGLFDLMINCFINNDGEFQVLNYFRIHNKSCQIILSYKFQHHLEELKFIREEIRRRYLQDDEIGIDKLVLEGKSKIIEFAVRIVSEFSSNIQVSALRYSKVQFPGVHIELEIAEKI
jgi:hypothetical protein